MPDHSTFTKNRHGRFRQSGLMRAMFERVVAQCLAEGLASAEHVAVDGSFVRADASYDRSVVDAGSLPRTDPPRAVREYLADLDTAAPEPDDVQRTTPKAVSLTDPAAALSAKNGLAAFAYGLNAMVDTGSGVVLGVGAAPERFADEPLAARRIIERVRERHGLVPRTLTADKAYGTGSFLAWLQDRHGIEAHVPLIDRRHQTKGKLTQDAFRYDPISDTYTCPQGAVLRRYGRDETAHRYRASQRDCGSCPIKARCTGAKMRAICRSPHEHARARVRAAQGTPAFGHSMRLRKRVERLFASIKHHDGLRRLRLRGLRGADEQFTLAATARNLKRMARDVVPLPTKAVTAP